jgi:antirestriction protein ArdC
MLTAAHRLLAEEHINELAEKYRIRVRRWSKPWEASEAELTSRQVFIPVKFKHGIDYLAALHEMGHIVDRVARGHERRLDRATTGKQAGYDMLVIEASAWAWALKTARPALVAAMTKTDWRRIGLCWAGHAGPVW